MQAKIRGSRVRVVDIAMVWLNDTFLWDSFCCSFGQIGLTVSNSIGNYVNMEELKNVDNGMSDGTSSKLKPCE